MTTPSPLPYGPSVTNALGPLRRGFRTFNRRIAAPMIRWGAGPLMATSAGGSIMVLRTVGRTSGLVREAPLGYALLDGRVVVVSGYGRSAHWFRNAQATPEVEVALPGAVLAGVAEEITDVAERRRAFRTALASFGVVGRITVGDTDRMSDAELDTLAENLPVLAIRPTGVLPGPYDPGGAFARVNGWLWLGGAVLCAVRVVRRLTRP